MQPEAKLCTCLSCKSEVSGFPFWNPGVSNLELEKHVALSQFLGSLQMDFTWLTPVPILPFFFKKMFLSGGSRIRVK